MNDKSGFIKRVLFEDKCRELPVVRAWDGTIGRPDIFICALGFEDRAVAISSQLADILGKADGGTTALLCTYSTNYSDNARNYEALNSHLDRFCSQRVETSADSPHEVRRSILELLGQWSSPAKCKLVLDISVASGSLILSIFSALIECMERVDLRVLYSEPQIYFPEKEHYNASPEKLVEAACADSVDDIMGESGVTEVEVNELYPGHIVESRTDRVLAVPAFRTSRLFRCLMHISDQILSAPGDYIHWVISEPPATELKWRMELQKRIVNVQLARYVGMDSSDALAPKLTNANHSVCSTRDYVQIMRLLMEQADSLAGSNLSLVHMGSKLQSVGVALALAVRSEFTVYSTRPQQFNPNRYSSGVGTKWILDLSRLDKHIRDLKEVGTLVLTPLIETSRDGVPAA